MFDLEDAIASFEAAATGLVPWEEALDRLARATGSVGTFVVPLKGPAGLLAQSPSLEEISAVYHRDGWYKNDARFRGLPHLERNGVTTDFDFISTDEMRHHPYWQDFLAAHGLRWFAGVRVRFAETTWVVSIQRTPDQGPFTEPEKQALARLGPHLSSAAALASALRAARIDATLAAYEASRTAIILLNRVGMVIGANDSARSLLGPDLQIRRGQLVSWDRATTTGFVRAVTHLLTAGASGESRAALPFPRRAASPLIAHLSRLPAEVAATLGGCACVVTLVDLERPPDASIRLIRETLGLTLAEARLALLLGQGRGVEQAAAEIGVTYDTARTQLRSIFGKLGIHRQTQLVLRVATLAERLPAGPR